MLPLFVVFLYLTCSLDALQHRKLASYQLLSTSPVIPISTTTIPPFGAIKRVNNDSLAKYREVEEIIPNNQVDGESKEPEISGQPGAPPHEPDSAPIDPDTPGLTGPQPPAVPPRNEPSFPVPPSPGPHDLPGLLPSPQPGIGPFPVVPTILENPSTSGQTPEASPYYPSAVVPTPPQQIPGAFYPQPPTTVQYPISIPSSIPQPPPLPPPATVYSSYSSPGWLNDFYSPSTVYYPNYRYNEALISYPVFSSSLKDQPSYLISHVDSSAHLSAIAPYIASPVAATTQHHINPLYEPQSNNQVHITNDTPEQELALINPYAVQDNLHKPTPQTSTITTTTTESSIEKDNESEADAERIKDI